MNRFILLGLVLLFFCSSINALDWNISRNNLVEYKHFLVVYDKPSYRIFFTYEKQNEAKLCWNELGTGKQFCEPATALNVFEMMNWSIKNYPELYCT